MATTTTQKPNIIFIMADDHASKALSCYGAGLNHTPHLDRLAKEGMRFNHCYVNNSICTPSRAAILTGTHSHVNLVRTLDSKLDNRLPNVAKQLRAGGYQTAMVGKWHLGEGQSHEPTGFDYWSVLPDQGEYWDPHFIGPEGMERVDGYVTDIITDKTIRFMEKRDREKPFFVMCHHKAPHRSWECDEKHKQLYRDPIPYPPSFDDKYAHRARAAKVAEMRVAEDLTYFDLGLIQPEGSRKKVGEKMTDLWDVADRKIPFPDDVTGMKLVDKETLEVFTFSSPAELKAFKYQRYMQRYLRTIQSIDDSVGRLLSYLETAGLDENTIVVYTSDQGFFLGDHGWFDKRFIYEESFQMPLLIRSPKLIPPGAVNNDIVSNVDFAPTFCALAGIPIPTYMQGHSILPLLKGGSTPEGWQQVAYHRYWMHNDQTHHAYAHYGCRDQRYKIIFWYNETLGVEGARPGDEDEKEWEMFDCREDPLELFNVYFDPEYRQERERMRGLLEGKMMEIGDEVVHSHLDDKVGEKTKERGGKKGWFWGGRGGDAQKKM